MEILVERDMKKKDLTKLAGISAASMAWLGCNENITTDVLVKVCDALRADIGNFMEVLPKESGEYNGKQKTSDQE